MDETPAVRSCLSTAVKLCVGLAALAALSACNSGNGKVQPASLPASGTGTLASLATSPSSSQGVAFQLQVSPDLTPSFSPLVHDYVTHCAGIPSVQLTAWIPNGATFGLIGPSGPVGSIAAQSNGQFQQSIPLVPGQRIQFTLSDELENYSVRCLPADFPPLTVTRANAGRPGGFGTRSSTPQAQWYVFAPTIQVNPSIARPASYVIITDSNGTPVWWMGEPLGSAIDAKILGPGQIAWTTPTVNDVGGQYVIRDFNGNVLNTITGNLNDHDLQPTPAGTFLAILSMFRSCPPDCADMSPWGGSKQAGVLDEEIVELDENSNVLWTWKTRDHIALSETGASGWFPTIGNDIIHMNAVEPDGPDRVMFSARHLNAIYRIVKSTGAIEWKIGGTHRPESLLVLNDLRPTATGPGAQALSGQHDVRRLADGTVSVHDNGSIANRPPAVVRYRIDTSARTAMVVEQVTDARAPFSGCCGSARQLPQGHWLVAWGEIPFLTELDQRGLPVLTVQFNSMGAFSYRAVPVLHGVISADEFRKGMDAVAAAL